MEIKITYGTGEASTKLASFDRALFDAGIANYNLIKLSSVIPEGAEVSVEKIDWNQKEHGYKLYVILSECIETIIGKEAWAGLGWIQDKTGKGLFVEIKGYSAKEVKKLIDNSLKNMEKYRPEKYGKINYKIVGIKCEGKPVCAVVAAVFRSEGW
jgi:arginine decarboxylase